MMRSETDEGTRREADLYVSKVESLEQADPRWWDSSKGGVSEGGKLKC